MAVATSTELQWALIWLNQRSAGEFPIEVSEEIFTEASVAAVSTWEVKTRAQNAIYPEPIQYRVRKVRLFH